MRFLDCFPLSLQMTTETVILSQSTIASFHTPSNLLFTNNPIIRRYIVRFIDLSCLSQSLFLIFLSLFQSICFLRTFHTAGCSEILLNLNFCRCSSKFLCSALRSAPKCSYLPISIFVVCACSSFAFPSQFPHTVLQLLLFSLHASM